MSPTKVCNRDVHGRPATAGGVPARSCCHQIVQQTPRDDAFVYALRRQGARAARGDAIETLTELRDELTRMLELARAAPPDNEGRPAYLGTLKAGRHRATKRSGCRGLPSRPTTFPCSRGARSTLDKQRCQICAIPVPATENRLPI
jgi:hypothetical protein